MNDKEKVKQADVAAFKAGLEWGDKNLEQAAWPYVKNIVELGSKYLDADQLTLIQRDLERVFAAGAIYRDENPSPIVLALVEALKFYSKESRMPQSAGMTGFLVEIYTKRQMDLAKDDGAKAREVLAEWNNR